MPQLTGEHWTAVLESVADGRVPRKMEQCAEEVRVARERTAADESRRQRELLETAEAMVGIAADLGVDLTLESAMNCARLGMMPPQLRQR